MKASTFFFCCILAFYVRSQPEEPEVDILLLNKLENTLSDRKAIILLRPAVVKNESISIECLRTCMMKGWKKSSTLLIKDYFNPLGIDLFNEFVSIRKKLPVQHLNIFSNLTYLLPESSPSLVNVEPCYMWAQNMTHVLMKVKFSPKIDMPGYSEIHKLNVNITLPELFITGYSFQGDAPSKFELQIKTYKFMNTYGSNWYQGEMGTLVLEIHKSPSPYVWRNLHSDVNYNPGNQYIWWDIYKKYKDSFEAGFSLLEDTEMKRDEKEQLHYDREEQMISDKKLVRAKNEEYTQAYHQKLRDRMVQQYLRDETFNLFNLQVLFSARKK